MYSLSMMEMSKMATDLGQAKGAQHIVIFFGRERFQVETDHMTGSELRRLFNVPADDFLYRAHGPKVEGDPIGDTEEVALQDGEHFLSVPKDIRGGATDLGLHPRQQEEVDELEQRYGALALERDGADALVILDVPAPGWTNDPLTVMVRIPAQYPDQRPDTIYIDAAAHPSSGRPIPRVMQPVRLADRQWNQISWHFTGAYNPSRHNLVDFVNSIQIYLTSPNP
jgi:E2/UBC family protein E